MQNFINIPGTETLTNSRQALLDNDFSIMSNFAGATFPTTNLQIGMECYRTDLGQLFMLRDMAPTWVMVDDLTKVPAYQDWVNTQLTNKIDSSLVVTSAQANKLLKLDGNGYLPANITGNAATATMATTSASCTGNAATATKLYSPITINGTTFDGSSSIAVSITSDALYNTKAGTNAMLAPSSSYNTAFGYRALTAITSGDSNTALGSNALVALTTGRYNVAIGNSSLYNCTTGRSNLAIGFGALNSCTTSNSNVAIGENALNKLTTPNFFGQGGNVAVGVSAIENLTTGLFNTSVGTSSSLGITTGNYNTSVGYSALTGVSTYNNCTGLGYQATTTGDNQVQLGNSSTVTYVYGTVQNRSDMRDKVDIRDTVLGLEFVNKLRPVDFKWDYREDYREYVKNTDGILTELEHPKDGSKKRNRYHHGLIAQEVKSVIDETGIDFGGYQDHSINGGKDILSIGYDELMAPMIKAIQELTAKVNEQATTIEELKNVIR